MTAEEITFENTADEESDYNYKVAKVEKALFAMTRNDKSDKM
jgi:hypothetical protein